MLHRLQTFYRNGYYRIDMEAKKLTDNSYLMQDSHGNRLGLVFIRDDTMLFTHDLEFYPSLDTIAKKFNEKLYITELPADTAQEKEINGYPIKHDMFYSEQHTEHNDKKIVTYKSREKSKVDYVAGWWVITTDSITRATLSPKLSTLSETSIGPYKTRFECQAEVTKINKEKMNE